MSKNPFNITAQNPHFGIDFRYQTIKRRAENEIIPKLEDKRALALIGLRRTGKTSILQNLINYLTDNKFPGRNILYFSFDKFQNYHGDALSECIDTFLAEFHGTNLELVGKKEKFYFFLDEVQKIPYFNSNLKNLYDNFPNFKFIFSGSSSYNIRKDQNETLLGRVIDFYIKPLDWQEYLEIRDQKTYEPQNFLHELIKNGKLPETHYTYKRPSSMYLDFLKYFDIIESVFINDSNYVKASVVKKLFDRELVMAVTERKIEEFYSVAKKIFEYNGDLFKVNSVSNDIQISRYLVNEAIQTGKKLFFWETIENFSKGSLFKLFASSTSIAYALTGENYNFDYVSRLFENKVKDAISEFSTCVNFYRERDDEIDFIIDNKIGIECKLGDIDKRFKYIRIAQNLGLNTIIFAGQDTIKLEKRGNLTIWTVPYWIV